MGLLGTFKLWISSIYIWGERNINMAAGVTVTVLGKALPPCTAALPYRCRENHSKYSSLNFSSHDEIVLMRLACYHRQAVLPPHTTCHASYRCSAPFQPGPRMKQLRSCACRIPSLPSLQAGSDGGGGSTAGAPENS